MCPEPDPSLPWWSNFLTSCVTSFFPITGFPSANKHAPMSPILNKTKAACTTSLSTSTPEWTGETLCENSLFSFSSILCSTLSICLPRPELHWNFPCQSCWSPPFVKYYHHFCISLGLSTVFKPHFLLWPLGPHISLVFLLSSHLFKTYILSRWSNLVLWLKCLLYVSDSQYIYMFSSGYFHWEMGLSILVHLMCAHGCLIDI